MRIRRIQITGFLLTKLCTLDNEFHSKCIKGLPEGARFLYSIPESTYGIWFVVEHESFDALEDGQIIPIHPMPEFERIDK